MLLSWPTEEIARLVARLALMEDAEETGPNEYVLDLYDHEPPLSMELALETTGVRVLAARVLAFDEALDGYYLKDDFTDEHAIDRALRALTSPA